MNRLRDIDYKWLALPMLALWLIVQCYSGLWHDSELYSFQALAHLHPDLLGNDLYLRYGSQDQFSLFPPLYAALIRWLGLESAAETLTILIQLTLLYAVWRFARVVAGPAALLALASVLAMPSGYGSGEVFHYLESFVTPRMAAEALALFALASWFSGRQLAAVLFWVCSCVLHPLMALAAAVLVVWHALLRGYYKLAGLLVLVAAVLLLLASRHSAWVVDDVWLATIRAGIRYLLLKDWTATAYALALLPLVVLACAARAYRDELPGRVASAALATGLSGLGLSVLGADLLHLTLVMQAQPWRWMWLSALIAAVLLPQLVLKLWRMNSMGRSTVLLLVTIYYLDWLRPVLILTPLALGAVWLATSEATLRRVPVSYLRLCEHGAQAAAAVAVAWNLSSKFLIGRVVRAPGYVPTYFAKVYALTSDGALPVLFVLAAIASWYWLRRSRGTPWWFAIWSMVLLIGVLLSLPSFQARIFPAPVQAVFARWQQIIPPRTEIFIPEDALAGWAMLLRPTYFTLQQSASEVYSRDAAMQLRERAHAATTYISRHRMQLWQEFAVHTEREPELGALCASTGVRFIVTRTDLSAPPLDVMPDSVGPRFAGLKLYGCPAAS